MCIATDTYTHGWPCACARKPIHTAGRVYSIGLRLRLGLGAAFYPAIMIFAVRTNGERYKMAIYRTRAHEWKRAWLMLFLCAKVVLLFPVVGSGEGD